MKFNVFGERSDPRVVLIHGALTPWQILEPHARLLSERCCVVVPALDGHDEDVKSEFSSLDGQAQKIEDYMLENFGGEVLAVCGLSLGGAIASRIWERGRLNVARFVLDGAPLVGSGGLLTAVMRSNYISIIRNSRKRDPKTLRNFSRSFLPECYLEPYLRIADCMSERSVSEMVNSLRHDRIPATADDGDRVLYIHGSKSGEVLSVKSAAALKKRYSAIHIHRIRGAGHCELAIYRPEEWVGLVSEHIFGCGGSDA